MLCFYFEVLTPNFRCRPALTWFISASPHEGAATSPPKITCSHRNNTTFMVKWKVLHMLSHKNKYKFDLMFIFSTKQRRQVQKRKHHLSLFVCWHKLFSVSWHSWLKNCKIMFIICFIATQRALYICKNYRDNFNNLFATAGKLFIHSTFI